VGDENCFQLLELAHLQGSARLKRAALTHLRRNKKRLANNPDWNKQLASLPDLMKEIVEAFVL
jgi:hypothetical protein